MGISPTVFVSKNILIEKGYTCSFLINKYDKLNIMLFYLYKI